MEQGLGDASDVKLLEGRGQVGALVSGSLKLGVVYGGEEVLIPHLLLGLPPLDPLAEDGLVEDRQNGLVKDNVGVSVVDPFGNGKSLLHLILGHWNVVGVLDSNLVHFPLPPTWGQSQSSTWS